MVLKVSVDIYICIVCYIVIHSNAMQQPKWRTRLHEKGHRFVQHTVQTGHAAGLKIKSTSNVAGLKLRNTGGMALSKIKNTVAPYRTRSVSIPNTPNTLIPGGEQQNDLKRKLRAHNAREAE